MNTNVATAADAPHLLLAQFLEQRRGGDDVILREHAAAPPAADAFEFVMSDDSIDRMGDSIEQNWILTHFRKNPIALFNHRADQVIGTWSNVRVEGGRLLGKLNLAAEGTSELIDTVRKLIAQKVLRAVSVGFRSLQKEKLTEEASEFWGPFRFLKSELLEASLVAVPANANAVAVAKSMNVSTALLPVLFCKPATNAPIERAVITSKPAKSLVPKGAITMTLSQKIQSQQSRVVTIRDRLTALSTKDQDTLTDEERSETTDGPDMLEAEENELKRLERLEKSLAPREPILVKPAVGEVTDPARPFAMPKKKIEPADLMIRAMAVGIRAFAQQTPFETAMRDMYGNDEATNIVLRAAVAPAQTTVAGWAAELVGQANAAFVDRLIADSIYAPLAAAGARYDLGRNGSIKVPMRTATNKAAGSWVGEGLAKPVKRISLAPMTLTPFKLAVISTFTEEMAMYSTPAIEGLLRQAMQDDTAESLDGYLIDAVAETATVRPAGLLNGVTPITASAAATPTGAMVADLKALVAAIIAAGGGRSIVILLNPAQTMGIGFAQTTTGDFLFESTDEAGRKFSVRFITSRSVPAGRVIAIDAADFATATGDVPRFAVSNEATLHEEDTTPLPLSATGTPNVVAAPMRSLFQTDSVAIRLSLFVTWKMRRAGMVQTINPVIW